MELLNYKPLKNNLATETDVLLVSHAMTIIKALDISEPINLLCSINGMMYFTILDGNSGEYLEDNTDNRKVRVLVMELMSQMCITHTLQITYENNILICESKEMITHKSTQYKYQIAKKARTFVVIDQIDAPIRPVVYVDPDDTIIDNEMSDTADVDVNILPTIFDMIDRGTVNDDLLSDVTVIGQRTTNEIILRFEIKNIQKSAVIYHSWEEQYTEYGKIFDRVDSDKFKLTRSLGRYLLHDALNDTIRYKYYTVLGTTTSIVKKEYINAIDVVSAYMKKIDR